MKKIVLDYRKDPELFSATAQEWAEAICDWNERNKDCRVKSTQLRNFYDQVMELEERAQKEPFEEVLPFVKMLNSKVAYAETRKNVNSKFVEMMTQCISQVNAPESLKTFKLFFEALIGFYRKK
jgi:CRISPR-associated protein Csm2